MYQFMRFPEFRPKALTLSYDDATVTDRRLIDIMSKNGIRGSFNINAGRFRAEDAEEPKNKLTAQEALALYRDSSNEIAAHGYQHRSLADIPASHAMRDLLEDRIALEELVGGVIRGMAYANGSVSEEVARIVYESGIRYARTTVSTEDFKIPTDFIRMPATCHHNNKRLPELTEKFLAYTAQDSYYWRNKPWLFTLWGHSVEFERNGNWNVIEEFCERVGNRKDVWYSTGIEIYDYCMAYRSLEWSAADSYVYNPTATDVYLNFYQKEIVAEAGKTTALR